LSDDASKTTWRADLRDLLGAFSDKKAKEIEDLLSERRRVHREQNNRRTRDIAERLLE
jgi:hypothetical protein